MQKARYEDCCVTKFHTIADNKMVLNNPTEKDLIEDASSLCYDSFCKRSSYCLTEQKKNFKSLAGINKITISSAESTSTQIKQNIKFKSYLNSLEISKKIPEINYTKQFIAK